MLLCLIRVKTQVIVLGYSKERSPLAPLQAWFQIQGPSSKVEMNLKSHHSVMTSLATFFHRFSNQLSSPALDCRSKICRFVSCSNDHFKNGSKTTLNWMEV